MNKFRKPHGNRRDDRSFDRKGERPSFVARPPFEHGGNKGFGQKYDATCAHCGKACQVPFRPNGKKPVFCKDCFNSDRAGSPARPMQQPQSTFQGQSASRPREDDRRIDDLRHQLDALHAKLDRIVEMISQPAAKKIDAEMFAKPPQEGKRAPAKRKIAAKKTAKKK